MRRAGLIFFLLVALSAAGYYSYQYFLQPKKKTLWELVPENAFAVYETSDLIAVWNDFITTSIWKSLKNIPHFQDLEEKLVQMDSITGKDGSLDNLLKGSNFLVSMHVISKSDFDFVFYIPLADPADLQTTIESINRLIQDNQLQRSVRNYEAMDIIELRDPDTRKVFSYIYYEQNFIGSFTPFLVEDVIRNIHSSDMEFKKAYQELFNIPKLDTDKGNLYVSFDNLEKFLKIFAREADHLLLKTIEGFLKASLLDVTFDDRNISLQGIAFPLEQGDSFLNTVKDQEKKPFTLDDYLPNRTSTLFYLMVEGAIWQNKLQQYWSAHSQAQLERWNEFSQRYDFDQESFFSGINGEIALAYLEALNPANMERLLFIKTNDINQAYNQINTLAERVASDQNDSVYYEPFADYTIHQIAYQEFPSLLFGDHFQGFRFCFYLAMDDYMVLSNNIETLKSFILDYQAEETWGKSISQVTFIESSLSESNFGLFVNLKSAAANIAENLVQPWDTEFKKNIKPIREFEMASFQGNQLDGRFYLNAVIHHGGYRDAVEQQAFERVQQIRFEVPLITKPFVTRNHNDNSLETLVQDSLTYLYLISGDGNVFWADSIGGVIKGAIEQIDFYKNGKLQYFFVTGNQLFIKDRNGNDISGFPKELPFEVHQWNVIDYDRSKNYRILVSNERGEIYMMNKFGETLQGWDPKKVNGRLGLAPYHFRVRGRDGIVAVQENGLVYIFNRRGEPFQGFPLDLKAFIRSPLYMEIGADFSTTVLTALSEQGEIIRFNLNGFLLGRDQLLRPSKDTKFGLVLETRGRSYIISQQDYNRLSLLDQNGRLILEKDYISSSDFKVQYYSFGSGNKIYAITDEIQDFTYLYDESGRLINFRPLESGHKIALIYFNAFKNFHVYKAYHDEFGISAFSAN